MKKYCSTLISLALSCMLIFSTVAYAAKVEQNTGNTLIIYSQECPVEAKTYAVSAYARLVQSAVESGSLTLNGKVSLGSPFTIIGSESDTPVYYFPIVCNSTISATLRVYIDQVQTTDANEPIYTGILSPYLANELSSLQTRIDTSSAILLYLDNGNVMAQSKSNNILLIPSSDGTSPTDFTVESLTSDLQSAVLYNELSNTTISNKQTRGPSAYLNLSLIEEQGYNNWCGAYATAAILRYLNGSQTEPTAGTLMEYFLINPSLEDVFSLSNTLSAGRMYGYDPVYVEDSLSSTVVFAQIDACKPIYLCVACPTGLPKPNDYAYHALVLRGYSRTYDTYSIWNPWHTYYETMDMVTKQYVASSTETFTWTHTIYDW